MTPKLNNHLHVVLTIISIGAFVIACICNAYNQDKVNELNTEIIYLKDMIRGGSEIYIDTTIIQSTDLNNQTYIDTNVYTNIKYNRIDLIGRWVGDDKTNAQSNQRINKTIIIK